VPVTIENTTPWNTEELSKFLLPLCVGTNLESIKVALLRAQPGVKREDQPLYEVKVNLCAFAQNGTLPTECLVQIISPKRAAARTDLLDRMAQVEDLDPHEIALPDKIVGGTQHAFTRLRTICGPGGKDRMGNQWDFAKHFEDHRYRGCDCRKPVIAPVLVRGNTKVRTAPPVDIDRLKQRGRWALRSAETYRKKMEASLAKAQKIGARIMKIEAKASDDASTVARH
jgi:hypothetical protein